MSRNNFDLIRLSAALQVALVHALAHLPGAALPAALRTVIEWFPGVPIFFFISGFLISRSFERNPVLRQYALNRALRIYPALIVCFVISLVSVAQTGYFSTTRVPVSQLLVWSAAQLSIGQFYNPDFMRHYAVGVLNGSTWTIAVELQFYVLVPLLYGVMRRPAVHGRAFEHLLLALIVVFVLVNQMYVHAAAAHARPLWYRLAGVTFAPWFYMFLIGVLAQRWFESIHAALHGRLPWVLAGYLSLAWVAQRVLGWGFGNSVNPVLFLALGVVTFAAAFSRPTLSDRLLRRNDVSYGVYIYHEPVINYLMATGLGAPWIRLPLALAVTLGIAYGSWRLVERPALNLKKHSLYPHGAAPGAAQRSRMT